MLTANVNLSPTTARRSLGVFWEAKGFEKKFTRFSHNLFHNAIEAEHFSLTCSIHRKECHLVPRGT
jgi:hypothetical protein